jgi:hypothetical protein
MENCQVYQYQDPCSKIGLGLGSGDIHWFGVSKAILGKLTLNIKLLVEALCCGGSEGQCKHQGCCL